jgi:hypothetical protein
MRLAARTFRRGFLSETAGISHGLNSPSDDQFGLEEARLFFQATITGSCEAYIQHDSQL